MKKLPILIFLFIMASAFCTSMCSFRSASDRIEADVNNALELAIKSGYPKDCITPVAEKESGIKLSEEERAGLNRMKELVETGEYDCVFAWEISRIARRKKILFSILEYLTERKIQLIIKEPHRQVSKYSYLCRDET